MCCIVLGVEFLYTHSPSEDKHVIIRDSMFHDLFWDLNKEEMIEIVRQWIEERS